MSHPVLLDTGPLVAFLKAQDHFHAWAVAELDRAPFPVPAMGETPEAPTKHRC